MAADIFLCFECGQRNRIPAGADCNAAKCGKCGAPLFPSGTPANARKKSTSNRSSPWPSRGNEATSDAKMRAPPPRSPSLTGQGKRSFAPRGLFLIAIILGGLWLLAEANNTASNSVRSQPSPSAAPRTTSPILPENLPPAVPRPRPGLLFNWTGRTPQAPLKIVTPSGSDYYVKLVDANTGADAVAIFVRGGQSIQVDVPLGTYRMRYASGQTWRGTRHLFGPGTLTNYGEAESVFDFHISAGYIKGYTVELVPQVGGNLRTRPIKPGQF